MERTILIRIGEIFLKGNNRGFFIAALKHNISIALSKYVLKITVSQTRIYLENYDVNEEDEIIEILKCIFGIHSISKAIKIETNIDDICEKCAEFSSKSGIFRVSVKRADKRFPMTSTEFGAYVGEYMLNKSADLSVNLFNYDFDVNIDIRENNYTYIFYEKIPCVGGLPVGTSGNGMILISGGIDSPVAAYCMAKRGVQLYAIHFHSYPYTSERAKEKVIDLLKALKKYCGSIKLLVVPFTDIQYSIKENCPIEYMITIMRRFMMEIAEKMAKQYDCGAIITGESLGQVASQTMESIIVTNDKVSLPVYRPLIGMDKDDIVDISKKIGTFDISILPYEDCCTVFLPEKPVIRPTLDTTKKLESKITNRDELINTAIENIEIIDI